MPWIYDSRAAPMTNPWSWDWDEPNDRIGYAPDGSMYESSPEPVLTGMPSAEEEDDEEEDDEEAQPAKKPVKLEDKDSNEEDDSEDQPAQELEEKDADGGGEEED